MVAAAFVAGFVDFGIMYSFGAFFEPMAGEFGASSAATSGFFSVTGAVFYLLGSLTGHLSDRFGPRIVVGTGAIVMGAGLALTAFIEQMWMGYLTYGLGVGAGAACAYVPTLAIIGGWFVKRRNTALGIAAAGTGCGMLVLPWLSAALIDRYGWRLADVILGAGATALLLLCAVVVASPPVARTAVNRPLGKVFRSREFAMLYISWIFATTALFIPFVFLPVFAHDHGAGDVAASALLSLLGGMSILSRLGTGALSDRIGTLRLFKLSVFIMSASFLLWLMFTTYGWLVAFSLVLGLGYGLRIALMPSVLIEFFGLQNQGAVLGTFFTAGAVSALLGPLLAGFVVDYMGSYQWGIALALGMGTIGFIAIAPLKSKTEQERGSS
jgi:MFS family permease